MQTSPTKMKTWLLFPVVLALACTALTIAPAIPAQAVTGSRTYDGSDGQNYTDTFTTALVDSSGPTQPVGADSGSASVGGWTAPYGCRDVEVQVRHLHNYVFWKFTVYVFHVRVHWCFIYDHIDRSGATRAEWYTEYVGDARTWWDSSVWTPNFGAPYDSRLTVYGHGEISQGAPGFPLVHSQAWITFNMQGNGMWVWDGGGNG